jgi:hypothetical protein
VWHCLHLINAIVTCKFGPIGIQRSINYLWPGFRTEIVIAIYDHKWRIQRGRRGRSSPPPLKTKAKKERESISAFIHSPVKCNKSLYIFTRCIALLVYLITFELLKQSTINQKTKWYYNPLDINLIKIHPFYKHFNTNYPIFNRETWENWLI